MLGAHACRGVGLQLTPGQARGVTVHLFARGFGRVQFFHDGIAGGHHVGVAHHLAQAQHPGMVPEGSHVLGGEVRAVGLKGGGGHAGRQHQIHVDGQLLGGVQQIAHRRRAAHVHDLVGVCDHGGGAAFGHKPRQLEGCGQGGLHVQVRVDEARAQKLVRAVHVPHAFVGAQAHHAAVGHGYVRGDHLFAEHVDHIYIFKHQVRFHAAHGGVDPLFSIHLGSTSVL